MLIVKGLRPTVAVELYAPSYDLSTPIPEFGFLGLRPGDPLVPACTSLAEALEAGQALRVVLAHRAALRTGHGRQRGQHVGPYEIARKRDCSERAERPHMKRNTRNNCGKNPLVVSWGERRMTIRA